ncbi:DNA recombination protein RmuC [Gemmatimonadota bacterium]
MSDTVIWGILILSVVNLGAVLYLIFRPPTGLSEGVRKAVEEDLRKGREESATAARNLREEVNAGIKSLGDSLTNTLTNAGKLQQDQLAAFGTQLKELSESNSQALEKIRTTLDTRVKELQGENEKKLEEMRKTVDEKLQGTLEKRLGESFKLVSDRLEAVQRGLGEMQNLATGVGDLKRVLTNVKSRGTWAEVQLGTILEQFLVPEQYARNVKTREGSDELVEFAIRLPGRPDEPDSSVWLPIDSKFPQEDYLRLQEAAEAGDADGVQKATEALARTLRAEAQKIQEKYLDPPGTTDFGIMFLATEGLYAEALRHPGLTSDLQRDHRIVVAGPTTLAAILSSLRMGFQTLAIEAQASEVWKVLGAVKTEFGKFGEVLGKVKRQLKTASRTIDQAETRTRAMERKLRTVEQLPDSQAGDLLSLAPGAEEEEEGADGERREGLPGETEEGFDGEEDEEVTGNHGGHDDPDEPEGPNEA